MATVPNGKGTLGLAALDESLTLVKHEFGRPAPGPNDVHIDIKYCGMCHSDVHTVNGDWGSDNFPMAPGHEIAGVVRSVGSDVTKFKPGDRIGVGVSVDSCRECDECKSDLEQHCDGAVFTYGSQYPEGHGHDECSQTFTIGGYTTDIVVHERFAFHIPDSLSLEHTGPLLCAGITMYSPLNRHVKGKKNQRVGIVGFGGLGHMGVKIAKAMGAEGMSSLSLSLSLPIYLSLSIAVYTFLSLSLSLYIYLSFSFSILSHSHPFSPSSLSLSLSPHTQHTTHNTVTVFSRSNKKEEAASKLGANLVIHTDGRSIASLRRTYDVIIDTVSSSHDIMSIISTLRVGGTYVLVGGVSDPYPILAFPLLSNRHRIEGSGTGGMKETEEMLQFCAEHGVVPEIEIIHAREAEGVFKRLHEGTQPAARAVIDISTINEL